VRKSTLHLVAAYATEVLTVVALALSAIRRDLALLIFALIFLVITSTFHITYMLSCIYEKLDDLDRRLRKGADS